MNKKMREILNRIKDMTAQARLEQDKGNIEKASEILDSIKSLRTEYENEKALYEEEKGNVNPEKAAENKADGFAVMAKMSLKKPLTDAENALVTGGASGENYLVPEDVDTTIRELRKSYVSAKDYVTVIPTSSLSGSMVYEKGTPSGLDNFTDGDDLSEEDGVSFETKKWAIKFFGKIFPVSNILLGSEKAGLVAYLNRWFVKNAIISENTEIFTALKKGKTAKEYKGLTALSSAVNKDLDPSALIGGVIITNQSGFDIMDSEVDAVGRPMLTKDLANPTQKRFKGLNIIVFPDAQLPNETKGSPIFVGDIKSGITMISKQGLEFDTSEHVFFKKNQNAMRVIEGFDVFQADGDAYLYGTLAAVSTASATKA